MSKTKAFFPEEAMENEILNLVLLKQKSGNLWTKEIWTNFSADQLFICRSFYSQGDARSLEGKLWQTYDKDWDGTSDKESTCQCRRHKRCGLDPRVGKIPWRRAQQPTPVLFVTPWTVAHQAPLSMGFSRQEYWSGVPLPSPCRPIRRPFYICS